MTGIVKIVLISHAFFFIEYMASIDCESLSQMKDAKRTREVHCHWRPSRMGLFKL